jgi:hypothetical protein
MLRGSWHLESLEGKYLANHVGGGLSFFVWPLELLIACIRLLVLPVRSFNSRVFLAGGAGPQKTTMKKRDFGIAEQKAGPS